MAFDASNIHPLGRHPITGNIVWIYISTVDALADILAAAYFTSTDTGLSVGDMILAGGTDATQLITVSAIDGAGDVTTVGGTVELEDIAIDSVTAPILPDIGGTVSPTNLREALERIHERLNTKIQNVLNIGTGVDIFSGLNTADPSNRRANLRRLQAGFGIEIELVGETIVVRNTEPANPNPNPGGGGTGGGTGGTGGSGGSAIPAPPANFGFANGSRLIYVTPDGTSDPIGGETATIKTTTLQSALNQAQPNDVILVRDQVIRGSFPLTLNNFAGTSGNPLWIVAENRGAVRISNLWAAADTGTQTWTNDGGGVYFASHPRPYIGSHNGDFLMHFLSEADLRAGQVQGVTKPGYGLAFEPSQNRVYVRLRNGVNPNGQSVKISDSIRQTLFEFTNADNVILDGFVFEGSGNTGAVSFNSSCANPVVRNCVFTYGRFGVSMDADNGLIDTCEYLHVGFGEWCAEVLDLDGLSNNGPFTLAKTYFNAAAVGQGGGSGNALLEGSIDIGPFSSAPFDNLTIDRCLLGPAFDGSNIGRYSNSEILRTVFFQCRDDGVQMESDGAGSQTGDNNEVHDCRFVDCFVGTSHQATTIGPNYVYRCIFENRDARFRHNTLYMLKMLKSASGLQLHHYHNLYINLSNAGNTNQFLWYDFSNGTGNRIRNFINNIIIFPRNFDTSGGPNPQTISNNAVVGPSAGAVSTLTPNGGVFAGTSESDMDLGPNLQLEASSPAVGIGTTLPGGFPDSRPGENDDAGPFPLGVDPGANWPREQTRTFDLNPPSQFES